MKASRRRAASSHGKRATRLFRRILYAADFSNASKAAFSMALDLAGENDAELVIVNVLQTAGLGDGWFVSPPKLYVEMREAIRRAAKEKLDALLSKAKKARVPVRGLFRNGHPHEELLRAARSLRADLIVMGTHGRTGFKRALLGSVAARVIARAPCPVLTVRGQ